MAKVFRTIFVLLLSLAVCTDSIPAIAATQDDARIVVHVFDAVTDRPIDNAQVFLLGGDSPQTSLTNARGLLIFDVQPGLYRVEVKAENYSDATSTQLDVAEAQQYDVTMKMQLPTIANVTSHASVSTSTVTVSDESAQRRVSQSLSDALNKIAGVSVDNQIYGADSAFNISLHGASASQTGYSVDGMQMSGAAGQSMGGLQDLFSGASVNFAPSATGSGGTVNFFTVQPTRMWNYRLTSAVGSDGNTLGTFIATGGIGSLSFAFERTGGGEDFPLNGQIFQDASGQTYPHFGGYSRVANLFKVSMPLSKVSVLKYTAMGGSGNVSYICSSATTIVPCTVGPDSLTHSSNLMQSLSFSSVAGHVQYSAFATTGGFNSNDQEPNRIIDGVVQPYSSYTSNPWTNFGFYGAATARRHTLSISAFDSVTSSIGAITVPGHVFATTGRSEQYSDASLSDKVKANDKLAITHNLSMLSGASSGTTFQIYEMATLQPRASDALSMGLGVGSSQPPIAYTMPIADPASADFDCYNGSTFIEGPSDKPTHQNSTMYNLSWRHEIKGGFVSAELYRDDFQGQSMRLAVPFASEAPSIFPSGPASYLGALQQIWNSPFICGTTPFNPNRVYVNQQVSGLPQVTQGFTLSAQIPIGRNVLVFPNYATTSAYLSALDPRFSVPGSLYFAGLQMPHTPLHTAGVTLDGVVGHSSLELLGNAQYTSADNPQNLPPYTTVNFGVVYHASRGSLQLLISNVFGTHTGLFTTYQGVNPQPVVGGGSFAFATTPLPPRAITVQYDLKWRQHVSIPKVAPSASPKAK